MAFATKGAELHAKHRMLNTVPIPVLDKCLALAKLAYGHGRITNAIRPFISAGLIYTAVDCIQRFHREQK